MAQRQRLAIQAEIAEVMEAEEGSMLCCTIEAMNAQGVDVSIQVMQDSINIAPYSFADDPVARLKASGVLEGLDAEIETVDWDANVFAMVGTEGLQPEEVAQLVDRTFVRLLSCDDEGYTVKASTEDLG
jgi:hypothetical protein